MFCLNRHRDEDDDLAAVAVAAALAADNNVLGRAYDARAVRALSERVGAITRREYPSAGADILARSLADRPGFAPNPEDAARRLARAASDPDSLDADVRDFCVGISRNANATLGPCPPPCVRS